MKNQERRIQERIPANFKVNYVHEEDYLISFTRNFSVGGMFLYTQNPPKVGDLTTLTFTMEDLPEITVNAKVKWVNDDGNPSASGMGVQFMDVTPETKEIILKMINRVAIIGT